jgi:hypothetical protein
MYARNFCLWDRWQRQYLHRKNLKRSLALLARSIDYRKNGSTRRLLFYRRSCDEKHGAAS